MEQVLTDSEMTERLVAEATEHVLRFDWNDVARRTAEVYEELAGVESSSPIVESRQRP
jgi:glycogen synthase